MWTLLFCCTSLLSPPHGGNYRDPGEPVTPSYGSPTTGHVTAPPVPTDAVLQRLANPRLPTRERSDALEILAGRTAPVDYTLLVKGKNLARGELRVDYVRCLRRCGEAALPELRSMLERAEPRVRAEAIFGILTIDREGAEAFALEILADEKAKPEEHMAALRGLEAIESPIAGPQAALGLRHEEASVVLESIRILRDLDDAQYAPDLVWALENWTGRPSKEAHLTLQSMTGYRYGEMAEPWQRLMKRLADGDAHLLTDDLANRRGFTENTTVSYLGVPLVGERVLFLIDMSGSMTGSLYSRTGQTRYQVAVNELERTLAALPDHARFQVVAFSNEISGPKVRRLVAPKPDAIEKALAPIKQKLPFGETDMHLALEEAFRYRDVDEILILTDGVPTAGQVRDLYRIERAIERWNRWRNLRISAVSLGAPIATRAFLQAISEDHGGSFRVVN